VHVEIRLRNRLEDAFEELCKLVSYDEGADQRRVGERIEALLGEMSTMPMEVVQLASRHVRGEREETRVATAIMLRAVGVQRVERAWSGFAPRMCTEEENDICYEGLKYLRVLLDGREHPKVRECAAASLGWIRSKESIRTLMELIEEDELLYVAASGLDMILFPERYYVRVDWPYQFQFHIDSSPEVEARNRTRNNWRSWWSDNEPRPFDQICKSRKTGLTDHGLPSQLYREPE
jgi:hypothetical protein